MVVMKMGENNHYSSIFHELDTLKAAPSVKDELIIIG